MLQAADNLPEQFIHQLCLVSRLEVSRPLLESPLLEASPVTIKGDSRGDLLGASDHMKDLSEGQGPHAEVLVRIPSWLRSTDTALEALRRLPPGHTLGLPFCTPRFHGKEL